MTRHTGDGRLPVRADPVRHEVRRVPRERGGERLVEEVCSVLPGLVEDPSDAYVWIACDAVTTHALAARTRSVLTAPGRQPHALGYWRP